MIQISLHRVSDRLLRPYPLSFATIEAFEGVYVLVRGDGRWGLGEATPLTGYNHETVGSVTAALTAWRDRVAAGGDPVAEARALHASDPFAASGALCALESWADGGAVFAETVPDQQLTAFVPGATPDAAAADAANLAARGFGALKVKIGRDSVAEDVARVRAVCQAAPKGIEIRLDANQAMTFDGAAAMVAELAALPVTLLEQPFPPVAWDAFAELSRLSAVPLMLDESIWTLADVERAATVGARLVKLKLGKHAGMAEVAALVARARALGLGVVFGNGVQTGVGNHLELLLHHRLGIDTASEGNGFAKVGTPAVAHGLAVSGGRARGTGCTGLPQSILALPEV